MLTVIEEIVAALVYLGIRTGMQIWNVSLFGTVYMALGVLIGANCVTSNLDAPLRGELRRLVKEIHQKPNTTFLYVTHDHNEALSLG